jgi:hypothetical protein
MSIQDTRLTTIVTEDLGMVSLLKGADPALDRARKRYAIESRHYKMTEAGIGREVTIPRISSRI